MGMTTGTRRVIGAEATCRLRALLEGALEVAQRVGAHAADAGVALLDWSTMALLPLGSMRGSASSSPMHLGELFER
jgi:hypothetical protein